MWEEESILKPAREKGLITFKGKPIRIAEWNFNGIFKIQRSWKDVFQILKDPFANSAYYTQQ